MIRLEIGLEIRHFGLMSLCVIEDLPLLLLHHNAVLQEIWFVSRPWFEDKLAEGMRQRQKKLSFRVENSA